MSSFSEFKTADKKPKLYPSDVYSRDMMMLSDDEAREPNIDDVISKRLALANITDPAMVTIYGERWGLVILPLFQMWKNEKNEDIKSLFELFFTRSLAELKLTAATGKERERLLIANYQPGPQEIEQKKKYRGIVEEGETYAKS